MSGSNAAFMLNETRVSESKGVQLVYGDLSQYSPEFKVAVGLLDIKSNEKALHYFQLAYEAVNQNDIYHNKYASYCGLIRLINGDRGGLDLCREVSRSELHDGDVFFNLARAEWHFNNRKKTIRALEKGLEIDGAHPGIINMRIDLGVRKRAVLPMLSRNHVINNSLGKLLRKQ
jgi:hypothetical protein